MLLVEIDAIGLLNIGGAYVGKFYWNLYHAVGRFGHGVLFQILNGGDGTGCLIKKEGATRGGG